MNLDLSDRKLTRRAFLRSAVGSLSAAVLAACGASTATAPTAAPAATAAPVAPTTAPAATAAQATAAPAATVAPTTAAAATTAPVATAAPAAKPTNTPAPLPEGSAGKLTVIHRTEYFADVQNIFRDNVTAYAKNKGIQLDISTANPEAFGDFNAKMSAAVKAGNPPDLGYHTLSIPQLYFLDVLEDLSDVVEEAQKRYGDIVPVIAAKNAQIEGKWYAVPFMANAGAWFARRDLLEAKGIKPEELDTYDKRRDAALAVSDPAKEVWGWGITINKSGDGHAFITHVIQSFGGRFVDKTGEKVTFNSPETVNGVRWLSELYTSPKYKDTIPPGVLSWTDPTNNENYLAGKVAFTANAFSIYGKAIKDKNPLLAKTAILRAPKANDGTVLEAGGNGWFTIFKGAKNVDAAKDLILYMIDPANFMPMVKGGGGLFLPAYKNLWTPEVVNQDPNFKTLQDIIFNDVQYTYQSYPASPNAAIAGIDGQAILSQMMSNIVNGSMQPEQAVEDANGKMVQIFEELGLPQS